MAIYTFRGRYITEQEARTFVVIQHILEKTEKEIVREFTDLPKKVARTWIKEYEERVKKSKKSL